MLAMYLAEYHGKGACGEEAGKVIHLQIEHIVVGKGKGVEASIRGVETNTAEQLCDYLGEHHSEVTRTQTELIHQVDKHKFHYLLHGSFLN